MFAQDRVENWLIRNKQRKLLTNISSNINGALQSFILVVQIINILTAGLLTSRLQTKEIERGFIMMRLSDYVVSGMHDNLGTLEHCGARGERCGFIMMLLSDYVVSGMHDNLGTLEHCGARCKQCLLLARYLNHHHEGVMG